MKLKNCLLVIVFSLFLLQKVRAPEEEDVTTPQVKAPGKENSIGKTVHVKALEVENVAKPQVEALNDKNIVESRVKSQSDENIAKSPTRSPNVENVAESPTKTPQILESQVETPDVDKVAESQWKTQNAENIDVPYQVETVKVENVAKLEETPNVENTAKPPQVGTAEVENVAELEEAPNVENVALLQSYINPELYLIRVLITYRDSKPDFSGNLKITIRCLVDTDVVVMNAKNMEITKFQIGVSTVPPYRNGPREIIQTRRVYFPRNRPDIIVIELEESLKKGLPYFVRSIVTSDKHLEQPETRKQILYNYTTDWDHHERLEIIARIGPNKASLLFPCFHEVNVKSKFRLEIVHFAENVITLSNWPVSATKDFAGNFKDQVRYTFEETALIPASGLSFAVVSFKSTDLFDPITSALELPVRIWADEKLIRFMTEARKIATKAMDFYLKYFNAPLYARKLDILAVPKFREGDTEKFGLISLDESSLVYYEADDQKHFDITRDLCFAMTGQWFGSSVTLSDLNERYFHDALSYFLEMLCTYQVNPNKVFDFYNLRNLITFSRTLTPDYETKLYPEFDSVFNHKLPTGDTQKALHLVQMLVFILNENTLRESLIFYLEKFEHSFANLDNLWEILTNEARNAGIFDADSLSVKEVLNTWMRENKFPLLRVNVDYGQQTITLSQEPFKFLGEDEDDVGEVCWNIRLSYASKTSWKFLFNASIPNWLTCGKSETFKIDLDPEEWIIVNSQLNVLSHTYFNDESWERIRETLLNPMTFSEIDASTRAHLCLDMFALAEAGVAPYDRVFHTMKYLKHETSELSWIVALTEFDKIYSYLLGTTPELLKQFQNYVREILDPVFNSISYNGKKEKLPRDDDLNEKSFDRPVGETQQYSGKEAKSTLSDQPANIFEAETNDSLREKPFRKLFDKPVKIDEIRQNDRLKMEFQKLFIRSSCKFGVAGCLNQSEALYKQWKESIENKDPVIKEIPIEIRDTVLSHIFKSSSEDVWKGEWKTFKKIKASKENDIMLKALGCFENEEKTLKEYLKETLKNTYQGNNLKAFVSLSSSMIGYSVMKNFLLTEFPNIKFHLKTTNNPDREPMKVELYFIELFNVTTKKEDANELTKFMKITKNNIDQSNKLLQKSIKKANKNVLWLETHKNTWTELLKGHESA